MPLSDEQMREIELLSQRHWVIVRDTITEAVFAEGWCSCGDETNGDHTVTLENRSQ